MIEKPEALRLADAMSLAFPGNLGIDMAAAKLRRLHADNERLLEALEKYRGQVDQFGNESASAAIDAAMKEPPR